MNTAYKWHRNSEKQVKNRTEEAPVTTIDLMFLSILLTIYVCSHAPKLVPPPFCVKNLKKSIDIYVGDLSEQSSLLV